jgi:A/G-specific adenine glycosylase
LTGFAPRRLSALRRRLLAWFDAHRRSLPFRDTRDVYRVWVSEVMLQQTTVTAVVPYYERFVARFPTVHALAAADESEVLKLWEGLGYYRRARHLHAAARRLVAQFPTALPDDPDVWFALPGVGRYILGAVLSRAFDRKLPIVEANSLRVLARLFGYRGDPRSGEGKKWVWAAAAAVLPETRCGDFNEALMELGALVCKPDGPKCGECPVRSHCVAYDNNLQQLIPPKAIPPAVTAMREVAVVIRNGPRVWLGQRPDGVRWAGMWELPHGPVVGRESFPAAVRRVVSELTGLTATVERRLAMVRHTVTTNDITMTAYEATAKGRTVSPFYTNWTWTSAEDAADRPTPVPQRKLLSHVFAPGR